MSWRGSRIDGGFHVVAESLASGDTVLASNGQASAGGPFGLVGLTIAFLKWTAGTAQTMKLKNNDGDVILSEIDGNILLEYPGIGSKRGQGITIEAVGSGSKLTAVLVPDADGLRRLTV